MSRGIEFVAVISLIAAASAAVADSWPAPLTREVFSASRDYFVRVHPGEGLGDTFGFAGEKRGRYAVAEFYRRAADRSYRLAAESTLLNPMAPVEFFVSDDGYLVTLDNWHNVGRGKVVAIYDSRGKPVQSYELTELFQPEEIAGFPHSTSSIHWHKGPAYLRKDQKTFYVGVKSGSEVIVDLESGQYQFCEYRQKAYQCRDTNQSRVWRPYKERVGDTNK